MRKAWPWPDQHGALRGGRAHASLLLAGVAAYAVAFLLLVPRLGPVFGAILIVPVAFAGWWFGPRWGAVAAFACALLSLGLHAALGRDLLDVLRGGIVGNFALITIGSVSGVFASAYRGLEAQRIATAEAETRARHLAEAAFDGIAIHEDGVLREVNTAFARLFGYEAQELLGMRVHQLLDESAHPTGEERLRSRTDDAYGVIGRTKLGRRLLLEVQARDCTYEGRPARVTAVRDVTHRIAAEGALKESEERFRTLFENVTIGLYRTTPDGRVLLANPALVRMLGYSSVTELMRRDLNAEDGATVTGYSRSEWIRRLENEGQIRGLDTQWRRKDGSLIHVRESAKAILGPDGRIAHFEGTVEDVTPQKRAEADLRASEALFRKVFDNSPIGMLFVGFEGTITDANDSFLAMLGHSREDLAAGKLRWDAITPPEHASLDRDGVRQLRATGRCRPFQKEFERTDGTRVPVVVAAALVGMENGGCVAFVVDVEERERARRELAETQLRQSGMLAAALDAIIGFDDEGTVVEWNAAAEDAFGLSRADAIGSDVRALLGPDARSTEPRREVLATRPDGSTFLCELTVVASHRAGAPSYTAFLRDLTEIKRLEQEREAQADAIARSERLSALGTLVAGVAHEINNPLTYIAGNIELALLDIRDAAERLAGAKDAPDLAETAVGLDRALGGTERIAHITRALRAVARQRSPDEREVVDLNLVLQDAGALLQVGIPDGIELDVCASPQPVQVEANVAELHQVILNLARNAIEALSGRPRGHVRLSAARSGDIVTLRVQDDGPGIPPDVLSKLFTPFYTTKPNGTGLGLSIVHGIVRDHKGDVTVTSDPRAGTTFSIHLPAHAKLEKAQKAA